MVQEEAEFFVLDQLEPEKTWAQVNNRAVILKDDMGNVVSITWKELFALQTLITKHLINKEG